jgi:hypothetical protein
VLTVMEAPCSVILNLIEAPCSPFTSGCQRSGPPQRLNHRCFCQGSCFVCIGSHQSGLQRARCTPTAFDHYCAADPSTVSRPFSSWNRPMLTEIYLCHACSYHEIEDGNGRAGRRACAAHRGCRPAVRLRRRVFRAQCAARVAGTGRQALRRQPAQPVGRGVPSL